jgi:hypothetical protein
MLLIPKTKVINVKPNKMGSYQLLISQFLCILNSNYYAPKMQDAKRHKSKKVYACLSIAYRPNGQTAHLLVLFTI